MSANIFKVKIDSLAIKHIDTETLINFCFEIPRLDFNFRKYIQLLSITVDKEEPVRRMPYARFVELLKINHDIQGDAFFIPLLEKYSIEFQNLKKSYDTNRISKLSHPVSLIWNNILAELKVGSFRTFPVLELEIEVAQEHDGIVAFPNHRGLGINSIVYREFMIRLLIDIQNGITHSPRIIGDWFESGNGVLYPEYPNRISYGDENLEFSGDEGIIWGIEEKNEIVIELDDTVFTDKYKGAWWLEGIESGFEYWKKDYPEWAEANKDYPFRIKTFSIIVHPAWFSSLEEIDLNQIYDSTAYGY